MHKEAGSFKRGTDLPGSLGWVSRSAVLNLWVVKQPFHRWPLCSPLEHCRRSLDIPGKRSATKVQLQPLLLNLRHLVKLPWSALKALRFPSICLSLLNSCDYRPELQTLTCSYLASNLLLAPQRNTLKNPSATSPAFLFRVDA